MHLAMLIHDVPRILVAIVEHPLGAGARVLAIRPLDGDALSVASCHTARI